jgi:hypothetical protein
MTSISFTNTEDNYYELGQELQKLASLIPTLPRDQSLSEVEVIEFVIAYIRQLQQMLSEDQWNECLSQLTASMKNSLLSSPLLNQCLLASSRTPANEHLPSTSRSPLATLTLDNTRLS